MGGGLGWDSFPPALDEDVGLCTTKQASITSFPLQATLYSRGGGFLILVDNLAAFQNASSRRLSFSSKVNMEGLPKRQHHKQRETQAFFRFARRECFLCAANEI